LGGVSTEEVAEHVNGVTRATRLQDALSVLQASFLVEGTVLCFHENGGEHVVTEDLTPKVSVILGIISSSNVAETSGKISSRGHWHASVERCELLKDISRSDVFGISEANVVNRLIEHSKLELTHVVNARVFVLGGSKLVAHVFA